MRKKNIYLLLLIFIVISLVTLFILNNYKIKKTNQAPYILKLRPGQENITEKERQKIDSLSKLLPKFDAENNTIKGK